VGETPVAVNVKTSPGFPEISVGARTTVGGGALTWNPPSDGWAAAAAAIQAFDMTYKSQVPLAPEGSVIVASIRPSDHCWKLIVEHTATGGRLHATVPDGKMQGFAPLRQRPRLPAVAPKYSPSIRTVVGTPA
jgi:hypothetical protein